MTTPGQEESSSSHSSSPPLSPALMPSWDLLLAWFLVRGADTSLSGSQYRKGYNNKHKSKSNPAYRTNLSHLKEIRSSKLKFDTFLMAVNEYFAGLALAAPFGDIYFGLWGYNCVLACIAIGGMFYALTWQVHLLAITCGK